MKEEWKNSDELIPSGYSAWKDGIIRQIHTRQLRTVLNVNADTLQNYWEIGKQILQAQDERGWGSHVIRQLSADLESEFGKNCGYSERNLRSMKVFAKEYPRFPIWQVPLAELRDGGGTAEIPLAQITWYHHISLLSKVKDPLERGFDVVIGNPPYISAPMQIADPTLRAQREYLAKCGRYRTLHEKWDLYIPFIELGTLLCRPGGMTAMIVPYPLTNQKYGLKMRRYLVEEHDLVELDDLNGTKVFENATVSNCIVFVGRAGTPCPPPPPGLWIGHIDESRQISRAFYKPFADLVQDPKTLVWNTTAEKREAARHADMHVLGDYCYISIGMVLNADEKIAKGEFTKDDLISDTQDKIHCKQYVEAKNIERYAIARIRYLEYGTKRVPGKIRRPTFPELYNRPKILTNKIGSMKAVVDYDGILCDQTNRICILWKDLHGVENKSIASSVKKFSAMAREDMEALSDGVGIRFLLGVLNSKYANVLLNLSAAVELAGC